MTQPKILYEKSDHVAFITINNPEKRNAIDKEMFDTFKFIFTELNDDPEIWLVVIRGTESNGKHVFSSGIDVMELASNSEASVFELNKFGSELQDSFNAVESVNKPVIAVLQGYCLGAGLELTLACDIKISTEDCLIGFPETELGIIPDLGGTTRMVRTVGTGNAKRMILTGDKITGKEAQKMGLIDYVVPAEEIGERLNDLIQNLLKKSPLALNRAKTVINKVYNLDLDSALQIEKLTQMELLQSDDIREVFTAKMEKRDPKWKNK